MGAIAALALAAAASTQAFGAQAKADPESGMRFVKIAAKTKEERTRIANLGVSLEAFLSDSVWGFASPESLKRLKQAGIRVLDNQDFEIGHGGHEGMLDFPGNDSRFHNYNELMTELQALNERNQDITRLQVIGKSVEGRNIVAIHINTSADALEAGQSNKPGVIFMGAHHAREHLSVEIPLMLVQHLLNNRGDSRIASLLDSRDIWVIPMVNPDGAEYDVATGRYRMWRKNRRNNGDGTYGVDLNRNYGFKWGTGGSSNDTSDDTYMGKEPFSEPETQTIRDFVSSHLNAKMLLTFHTFSELILYPWGHSYDSIGNSRDLQVFERMARTMAGWNKYTPEQASDLYIASGDTTDWAYGEHGIFAFTFELSPKSMFQGGFYPGQAVIDKVFNDNLRPCLYMIELADDPYRAVSGQPSSWLKNYVEPSIPAHLFWETRPF